MGVKVYIIIIIIIIIIQCSSLVEKTTLCSLNYFDIFAGNQLTISRLYSALLIYVCIYANVLITIVSYQ